MRASNILIIFLLICAGALSPAIAQTQYSIGNPTPEQQYMVELINRALELFPNTGFTNAYGLTETSSTIALLGPEEHRAAQASSGAALDAGAASSTTDHPPATGAKKPPPKKDRPRPRTSGEEEDFGATRH